MDSIDQDTYFVDTFPDIGKVYCPRPSMAEERPRVADVVAVDVK